MKFGSTYYCQSIITMDWGQPYMVDVCYIQTFAANTECLVGVYKSVEKDGSFPAIFAIKIAD